MKKQIHYLFTALMFYTQIRVPQLLPYHPDDLNKATRYFPLIGWIVATLSFTVYFLSSLIWPTEIAVTLSLIASLLITGAFHEDGFADSCDGFGGGWTKANILRIMKDSAIGAYGAIGLTVLFLLKFTTLTALFRTTPPTLLGTPTLTHALLLITAHSLSRLAAISIVFTHPYSRDDATSKSKPIAQTSTWIEKLGAITFGLLPLLILLIKLPLLALTLIPLWLTRTYLARYFQKWLDGYTGDCLGATQQLTELIFYLTALPLLTPHP